MTDDERFEWSDAERRALASLGSEAPPPPGVEDRVVEELALRGAFAKRTAARAARLLPAAAAAALLLFAAGVVVGRNSAGSLSRPGGAPEAGEPRFALFLLDEPPGGAAEEPARVAEYKAWAASLPRGSVLSGEKLGDAARLLTSAPSGDSAASADSADSLRGYFVIRARDLAHAVEVARSCPHWKRGGRILVRPIVPV